MKVVRLYKREHRDVVWWRFSSIYKHIASQCEERLRTFYCLHYSRLAFHVAHVILSTFIIVKLSRVVNVRNCILSPVLKLFARHSFAHPRFSLLCRCPPCNTHSYCTGQYLPRASRRDTSVRTTVLSGNYRAAPISWSNKDDCCISGAHENNRCASLTLMCNRRKYVLFERVRSEEK